MSKRQLKVTICSYDGKGYFGGPYEWLKRIAPCLRDAGVEVSLLFFSDHKPEDSSTYLYLRDKGFYCKVLPNHSFTQYHDNTEDRVRWFLEQVKENPPDVLIANVTLYALYATKWLTQAGIPVVGILHSDDPRHAFMYEEFVSGDPAFTLSAVVGVSTVLSEKALGYKDKGPLVTTISCGTPVPPEKASYRQSPFKIVYAGKITDEAKRITETTHILCQVVKTLPGTEVELYGSGDKEKEVQDIIRKEAEGYPISFKGLISSNEIQQVFSKAQAFILLSDYEGLPVALLEAMAVGLVPVCANIRSGIPELIEQDVTGILVNDRLAEVLPAIEKLQSDPERWHRLSQHAINKVKEKHAIEIVTQQWIDLCETLKKNAKPITPVTIPERIVLPPVNPWLKGIDVRKPSFIKYLTGQIHRIVQFSYRVVKR